MARSAQLIINGDAGSPPGAEWVVASNVLTRGFGAFSYDNGVTPSFAAQNAGAYDFYQDVAIPGGNIAAVDAGLFAVDYDAVAARISGGTSVTMTLKALNGVGAVLTTWSLALSTTGKPYTQFTVRMQTMPVGTRTIRAGWSGSGAIAGDAWFEALGLYFEDVEIAVAKFNGYAIASVPASNLAATKFLGYGVEGAGNAGTLSSTKFIAYGVLFSPHRQRLKVRLLKAHH